MREEVGRFATRNILNFGRCSKIGRPTLIDPAPTPSITGHPQKLLETRSPPRMVTCSNQHKSCNGPVTNPRHRELRQNIFKLKAQSLKQLMSRKRKQLRIYGVPVNPEETPQHGQRQRGGLGEQMTTTPQTHGAGGTVVSVKKERRREKGMSFIDKIVCTRQRDA